MKSKINRNIDSIWLRTAKTNEGNTLSVFFHKSTNLLVVDVVHRNESGGNEIVRMTFNEERLLAHGKPKRKRSTLGRRKEQQ